MSFDITALKASIEEEIRERDWEDPNPEKLQHSLQELEKLNTVPSLLQFLRDRCFDTEQALRFLEPLVSLKELKVFAQAELTQKLAKANFTETLAFIAHPIQVQSWDQTLDALQVFCNIYDPDTLHPVPESWST